MSTTDAKLYRIFVVAGERRFASRAEMARYVAKQHFDEFSYEEEGETRYLTASGVGEYVSFATMIGLLNGDMEPYLRVEQVTKRGFEHTLGEKVENFVEAAGFPAQKLKNAILELISREPAQLPTPKAIHALVQPNCTYHIFYKAATVRAYQERSKVFVRSKHVLMNDDVLIG